MTGRFALGESAAGTHWIGGWIGPRADPTLWRRENLGIFANKVLFGNHKNFSHCQILRYV
jgi:hypothetical protein